MAYTVLGEMLCIYIYVQFTSRDVTPGTCLSVARKTMYLSRRFVGGF